MSNDKKISKQVNKIRGFKSAFDLKLKIKVILLSTIILISSKFVYANTIDNYDYINGTFQKLNTPYPVVGNPVKLNDGRILITGGKKDLLFNPKTNEFKEIANPFPTISYLDGRVLNTNKVLFNSPFWKYPSELFSSYGYIREEMEREEIAKTVHLRPTGMSINDYRQKQKDKARENYAKLSEEEKGNIFRKYNQNNPELLKKYNDYVERYEKSLYAQLYNPDMDKWEYTGKAHIRRMMGKSVVLNNGDVLYIGGIAQQNKGANLIEIYNAKTGTFEQKTTDENTPKIFYGKNIDAIYCLKNDNVIIFIGTEYLFYNPKTNQFTTPKQIKDGITDVLPSYKDVIHSIMLKDGRIILFLGRKGYILSVGYALNMVIFNPLTEEFIDGGSLAIPRGGLKDQKFNVVELKNGEILITGGQVKMEEFKKLGGLKKFTNSAEIYNPTTKISAPISSMNYERSNSSSILLDDGRVLIYGGACATCVEMYIPKKYK